MARRTAAAGEALTLPGGIAAELFTVPGKVPLYLEGENPDTASETYERELDEGLEEDARDQLRQVDEALARIESGDYGTCVACGKEIPSERLEAVPWTSLCIEDARKRQR